METIIELLKSSVTPIFTGFIGVVIGFWVDVWKDNFRRKARLREEHDADIRRTVLAPLYQELNKFYCPICEMKELPIEYHNRTIVRVPKDIEEDSYGGVEPAIAPRFSYISSSQEFVRYFEDALEYHYPDLLGEWGKFEDLFTKTTLDAVNYAEKIAADLKSTFDLPSLSSTAQQTEVGINHERIAVLIFRRQFGIENEALKTYFDTALEGKISNTQETVVRAASREQLDAIFLYVNRVVKDKNVLGHIKGEYIRLGKRARYLFQELDQVLAQKPKIEKCPLV